MLLLSGRCVPYQHPGTRRRARSGLDGRAAGLGPAGAIEHEQAKANLDVCLALAGDCHAIYMSIDDSLRRIANQAFFNNLIVTPDDSIDGEPGESLNILFDPAAQWLAVRRQGQNAESGPQTADVGV